MNLASSLVQSFMYADMFNREYEGGGSDEPEKITVAGLPVQYIAPSLDSSSPNTNEYTGGGSGPFENKVVPAGLVLIPSYKDPDVEYEEHLYPGLNREVIPDSIYDNLVGSVLVGSKTPSKKYHSRKTAKKHKKN